MSHWGLYLQQQLETGDALERQNQEGLEGQALADGVALQLLQDLPETAVGVPVQTATSGEGQAVRGTQGRLTGWRLSGMSGSGENGGANVPRAQVQRPRASDAKGGLGLRVTARA